MGIISGDTYLLWCEYKPVIWPLPSQPIVGHFESFVGYVLSLVIVSLLSSFKMRNSSSQSKLSASSVSK